MWSVTCAAQRHAALLLLVLGACAPSAGGEADGPAPRRARPPGRALDADLLALAPDGAQLLVTVDLRQLRATWPAAPWARGAAEATARVSRRLPGALGGDLLARADVLVLALWLDEGPAAQLLLLARGGAEPDRGPPPRAAPPPKGGPPDKARRASQGFGDRVGAALRRRGSAMAWERYRDVPLATAGGEATAILTGRTVVAGPLPLVKHAVDLAREVPGLASAREDRTLMALWKLVAGPGVGRAPAVVAVSAFPASVRERLGKRVGLGAPPLRGGLRLSVGPWLTLRAFLDCPDGASARALIDGLRKAVQRAARSPLGRELRLAPLLARLSAHHEGARVHLQWLAPRARVDPWLSRLGTLLSAPPPRATPGGRK